MAGLHVGFALRRPSPAAAIDMIVELASAGIETAWSTSGGVGGDTLTLFGAAAPRTSRILLGTSIVPTYPRHPTVLAAQALIVEGLAPGRLRLGIGPSHRPTMVDSYGLDMGRPLAHLREYLTVLRELLWDGRADFDGAYLRVHASLPSEAPPPRTPLPISALRVGAFRLAGEIADGGISWMSPVPYLIEQARPAMVAGAEAAGRARPPLIGHVPVAMHTDRNAVRAAARAQLSTYGQLPFYAGMFADAGYPVASDGTMSDALFDELVVSGDPDAIAQRLSAIQAAGVDEILVTHVPIDDRAGEEAALVGLLGRLARG
jgi:F420-dependent oxidoreductase-like protein